MSSEVPPIARGQISPDGLWLWDGARWVPTAAATPAPTATRSRAWIWWLSGCAVLVAVIAVAGLAFGGIAIFNAARSGAFNCLPSDFPAYPGQTLSSVSVTANGATRNCEIVFESSDSPATVHDFYQSRLSQGPWEEPQPPGPGEIDFVNPATKARGSVNVTATSSGSEIIIDLSQ